MYTDYNELKERVSTYAVKIRENSEGKRVIVACFKSLYLQINLGVI